MVLSTEHEQPSATLKDILDGSKDVPVSLRLDAGKRKLWGAYLDAFGLRSKYENSRLSGLDVFTQDPTFKGFERGYNGREEPSSLWEEHLVAARIGYNAGREVRRQTG